MKTPFRRRSPGLSALLLSTLMLAATCGWATREAASADASAAATIPEFLLAAVDGDEVGREAFAGRVVLFEFWATWCTPCHVQVEILKQLYPRASAAGVEFVAVATGEPEEIVRRYAADKPVPYPSLLDPDEKLATSLEVLGLPTLVVAGPDGTIVWRQTGLTDAATLVDVLRRAGADVAD